jgi:thioredoxin reductase (NADPH)
MAAVSVGGRNFVLNFRLGGRAGAQPHDQYQDVIIIGGGPGGLAAGLYAARAGLKTVVIEKGVPGGQMATTERIENCPGCIEGSGAEIGDWIRQQGTNFGLNFVTAEVASVDLQPEMKIVRTKDGEMFARAIIIGTGARPRRLGVPGEDEFWGRGVSVCATCDGPFSQEQTVAVIGGGDSAVKEGDYLTRFADKVIIMHRRDELRADRANQLRAQANPKVEFLYNVVVQRILGEESVRGVEVRDIVTHEVKDVPVQSVFIYIGLIPNTDLFRGQVDLDEWGYVKTDNRMRTSAPGVWAVGDVRADVIRQVVTAMADGAIAAISVEEYLREHAIEPVTAPMAEQKP